MRANSEAYQHVDHRAKDFDYLGRVVPASMQTQGKESFAEDMSERWR